MVVEIAAADVKYEQAGNDVELFCFESGEGRAGDT